MSGDNSPRDERLFRNILVPLDGSESAEIVLELARNLAARSGAALTLLNVCRPSQTAYERMHRAYIDGIAGSVRDDIAKLCQEITCHFKGVSASVLPLVVTGEPSQEIVDYAEQNEVSVILMATHGRGGSGNPIISDTTTISRIFSRRRIVKHPVYSKHPATSHTLCRPMVRYHRQRSSQGPSVPLHSTHPLCASAIVFPGSPSSGKR